MKQYKIDGVEYLLVGKKLYVELPALADTEEADTVVRVGRPMKSQRKGRKLACSLCGVLGHRKSTCPQAQTGADVVGAEKVDFSEKIEL